MGYNRGETRQIPRSRSMEPDDKREQIRLTDLASCAG
jgi:hypothetical protein